MRKTKVIATIGPSSFSLKVLKDFKKRSVDCIRINTAHGDFDQYKQIIETIQEVGGFTVMLDIKGPDIRVRLNQDLKINKSTKVKFYFNTKKSPSFSYNFSKDLKTNNKIFFDNGLLEGRIISINKDYAEIKFNEDFTLKPNKGVNIPNTQIKAPKLSKKDLQAINFAKKHDVDYIALSFVRDKYDVLNLKNNLKNTNIGIISKIENWQGVKNIDDILKLSDGVMIARGDLGVEIEEQRIPLIQKQILKKANSKAKISIVATQLLETMIKNKSPTRAEISDTANAILDGADALMLSGETAVGDHPLAVLKVVEKTALEVEKNIDHNLSLEEKENIYGEISKSVYKLSKSLPVNKIVTLTNSGFSSSLISRFRLNTPIIAVTTDKKTSKKIALQWGVLPVLVDKKLNKYLTGRIAKVLVKKQILDKKEIAVFFAGIDSLDKKVLNILEIHRINDLLQLSSKKVS